jgi:hypothetical protein
MKICNGCKIPQNINNFNNNKNYIDGIDPRCKTCYKQYREINKDRQKQYDIEYKTKHKEKLKLQDKEYYLKYKKKPKQIKENKYTKEYIKEYNKNWNILNKDKRKIKSKEWFQNNKTNIKENNRNRYKKDIQYKLRFIVSTNIHHALKRENEVKKFKSKFYLGCDVKFYKQYLESMFLPEMTWENHGNVWEIDHIKPLANFNLINENESLVAFNYKNTEPRFKTSYIAESLGYINYIGNREKSNKII